MTATEYIPPHLRGLQATAEKSSQAPSTSEPATKPVTAPASLSHLPPHLRGFQQPSKSSVESATPSPPSTYEKVNATPPGNTEKVPAKFLKPYPCTYEECLAGFETLLKLKNHKKDRHDYCGTCDLDFVDDTDLLRHKIDSDKHIVCPVCGQSFRSSNGRDHHVKQAHAQEQNIRCQGCAEVFIRAGGLMDHIEKGNCTRITKTEFEKQRAMKAFHIAHISRLKKQEPKGDPSTGAGSDYTQDSAGGGVALNMANKVDANDENAYSNAFPTLAKPETAEQQEEVANILSDLRIKKAFATSEMAADTLSVKDSVPAWNATTPGGSSATLFPNAPKTPASSMAEIILMEKSTILQLKDANGQIIDPSSMNFDPYKFQNAIGGFKCPYPSCGSFSSVPAFRAHLNSPMHKGVDHRCPYCLKIFKSPTALTQHMEAPTTNCRIKETTEFAHAVSLVSGGFLNVAGQFTDGTIKFEAGEPGEPHEPSEPQW